MRSEERVRLLREAGHDIRMSMCIVPLGDGFKARECRVSVKFNDLQFDSVQLLELDETHVEEVMQERIDTVMQAVMEAG